MHRLTFHACVFLHLARFHQLLKQRFTPTKSHSSSVYNTGQRGHVQLHRTIYGISLVKIDFGIKSYKLENINKIANPNNSYHWTRKSSTKIRHIKVEI